MEREIRVIVKISNMDHAQKIRQDIEGVIELRTPIYWISEPFESKSTIDKEFTNE